jgi:beta-xylosidase
MNKIFHFAGLMSIYLLMFSCTSQTKVEEDENITLQSPIIPGYFADPSVVQYEGKFYMYVTADPWGTDFLSCWVSDDFQNWTFNKLNWPTRQACTSPNSNENMVWAPSVIKKGDYFYMYVSVGSEIWCGKSSHPLGPWENMLDNQPMIPYDTTRYYHVIDAEAFIDDDGKAYLYWGSRWDWINGHCFAAELNDDMRSFKTEPVEVTPTRYFEAPLMIKKNGKYYLTYSEGKTIEDTYEVRYSVGDNPLGPFEEAANSPILKTDKSLQVYGPGHHTVFNVQGKKYILYHRHRLPFVTGTALRQTCIKELEFDAETGDIKNIVPEATQLFPNLAKKSTRYIKPENVYASSEYSEYTKAGFAIDNSNATRWEVADKDEAASLTTSFKDELFIDSMEVRMEYPWKTYFLKVEGSTDNMNWNVVADHTKQGVSGSPVLIPIKEKYKSIRLSFTKWDEGNKPSLWEVKFFLIDRN